MQEFPTPSNNCTTLDYTSTYKYLGVLFSEHLDINIVANDLAARASRALGSLISKYYINNGIGYNTYVKLYTACITKIADYCSGVWGLGLFPSLESVHNRAIRSYLGVHKYTPLSAVKGKWA